MEDKPYISILGDELNQTPKRRQELLRKLGDAMGKTAVAFFTSFRYPVMIEEDDADMIEEVLHATDLSKGLCLVLNSPGGDAIAAERIVHTCRVYANGKFDVWIPRRAKSAATMIALGADKIYMGKTSALGPIDPQTIKREPDGNVMLFPVYALIKSYDDLMEKAIATQGNLEPYLQQLSRYDAAEIEELRRARELAADIAIRCLKEGMLSSLTEDEIREKISIFLQPEITKAHARDIRVNEAKQAGLNIEEVPIRRSQWRIVSELYTRADYYVSSAYCKMVESPTHHFALPCLEVE